MKVYPFRFNIYLALIAAVLTWTGCQSTRSETKKLSGIRIHIESNMVLADNAKSGDAPDGTDEPQPSETISLLRTDPVSLTVLKTPVLSEDEVLSARVLDTPDGFGVEVKFNSTGTIILEQYSAANQGKHFVIFGQWGEKGSDGRWLAAPMISHRITNGVLSFTPDMSQDDAYRLVLGLNNVAKANEKGTMK